MSNSWMYKSKKFNYILNKNSIYYWQMIQVVGLFLPNYLAYLKQGCYVGEGVLIDLTQRSLLNTHILWESIAFYGING